MQPVVEREQDQRHRHHRLDIVESDGADDHVAESALGGERLADQQTDLLFYEALHGSLMSRPNIIVAPGSKMDLAMRLIFMPMMWRPMERRKQALGRRAYDR